MKPVNIIHKLNEDSDFDSKLKQYRELQQSFAENLDLLPLFNKIHELLGDNTIQFSSEIKNGSEGPYIEFSSEDIVDRCGIFQLALKYLVVDNFSTGIYSTNRNEFFNDTTGEVQLDEPHYYVSVHFSYKSHNGGMNGMEILRASYNEKGDHQWLFRETRE